MENLECNKHKLPIAIVCAHPNCEEILLCSTCIRKHSSQHLKTFYPTNIFDPKTIAKVLNRFIESRGKISHQHDQLRKKLKEKTLQLISELREAINKEIDSIQTILLSFLDNVTSFSMGKSFLTDCKIKLEQIVNTFNFEKFSELKCKVSSYVESYEEFNSLYGELVVPFDICAYNLEFKSKYNDLKEKLITHLTNFTCNWNNFIPKYSHRNLGALVKSSIETLGKNSEKLTSIVYDAHHNFIVASSMSGLHFYRVLPNMTLFKVHFKKIKEGEIIKIKWIEEENIFILVMRNGHWKKYDYQSSILSPAYDFEEEIIDLDYCSIERILIILGSVECKMYYMGRVTPKLALTLTNANTHAHFSCIATMPKSKSTLVALGLGNGWLHVVNLNQPNIIHKIHGHSRRISSLCFINNGAMLISSSEDLTIRYWSISKNGKINCVRLFKSEFYKKVFIINDKYLAILKGNNRNFELRGLKSCKRISQKKIENTIKDAIYVLNLSILFYIYESGIYSIKL